MRSSCVVLARAQSPSFLTAGLPVVGMGIRQNLHVFVLAVLLPSEILEIVFLRDIWLA